MKVYVNDILVKSKAFRTHIEDLEETFATLRKYKMKLNPTKCAFGGTSGKFLSFMVSYRGIETNPKKIQAIIEMRLPRNIKEIQYLTGRVVVISRFVSRSVECYLPFF